MVAARGDNRERRASLDASYIMDEEEEQVTVRPAEGAHDDTQMEVRISCPDATGLGCDVARMLFDFGLRITDGDVSTDGKWCFLIFKVKLSKNVPAHWTLLKERLKKICPVAGSSVPLLHTRQVQEEFRDPFLLTVDSYDRRGFLHDLMHTLWEADVMVFKAHITTGPDSRVVDMFWMYDHRAELPENHRVLQIKELVKECLRQRDVKCTIEPAPAGTSKEDSAAMLVRRCACVDASATSPLRRLLSVKRRSIDNGSVIVTTKADDYAAPEEVQVSIDNCTSPSYSVVNVVCNDRKGLVYDLMRTLKDIHIRVAYAKLHVTPACMCRVDLFVQEVDGNRITDSELQEELIERVRNAVLLPVRIAIKEIYDDTCTELLVTANLDSGGRGRPRVTYDVTAALSSLGLCVFMADVYIDVVQSDTERPVELHRFLIHRADGTRLRTAAEKQMVYNRVRERLMGAEHDVVAPEQRKESNAEQVLESLSTWKWSP